MRSQHAAAGRLAPGTESQGRPVLGSRQGLRDIRSSVLQLCFVLSARAGPGSSKGIFIVFHPRRWRGRKARAVRRVSSHVRASLLRGSSSLHRRGSRFSGFILHLAIKNILSRVCEVCVWGTSGLWLQGKGGGCALVNSLSCTSVWYQQSWYPRAQREQPSEAPCDSSPFCAFVASVSTAVKWRRCCWRGGKIVLKHW